MASPVIAIILVATIVTATISGIFGMAGGLILMGVLAAFTPVATAMVLHGFIQIISNFSRAALLWKHISWAITGRYALGIGAAITLIALDRVAPYPAGRVLDAGSHGHAGLDPEEGRGDRRRSAGSRRKSAASLSRH